MPIVPRVQDESIRKAIRKVGSYARNSERGSRRSVRASVERVRKSVASRVFQARGANRQDNPQKFNSDTAPYTKKFLTRRSPVSSKQNGKQGAVRLKSYRAKIRKSRTGDLNLVAKFTRQHYGEDYLLRKTLRVNKSKVKWPDKKSDYSKLRDPSGQVTAFAFQSRPRLTRWANRRDKGRQIYKHNIALPFKVRLKLVAIPSANAERERVREELIAGALAGLDGRR